MATATLSYGTTTAITMDLANLVSSTTLLAGRESSQIDNTSNKFIDAIVNGSVSVGSTNPTTGTNILVYVYAQDSSVATSNINTLTGTDGARTLDNAGIPPNALKLGAIISVPVNTINFKYNVAPFSVANLFGGILPKYWGLFVTHNTGVNLRNDAVNTSSFTYTGIKYDIA